MDIVETLNEGLKREYRLTIMCSDIEARIDQEVKDLAPKVRMPGFRPGKVPPNLVRKMHGASLSSEALNKAIDESVTALIADRELRPALQPMVTGADSYESGKDTQVSVALEVLPTITIFSLEGLKLERLSVLVDESAIDEALERLAGEAKRFEKAQEDKAAEDGNRVIIDFVGSIDGTEFEGGTGENMAVELGSGEMIPGFEDQLIGAKTSDERKVKVTFPADYQVDDLKDKDAVFAVKIRKVESRIKTLIDDQFAKSFGIESLKKLREMLKTQLGQEYEGLTRTHMKRCLLDQLAAKYDFDVPETMVEAEFAQIWQQVQTEAEQEDDVAAAKAELDQERDEYRSIAVRRVRLGLLLSEIGRVNDIQIDMAEMQRLVTNTAQQYRAEDRERFLQVIQQDPMAAAQLRAPLYEDKVVDFLFDKAEVTERDVTREKLEMAIESGESDESSEVIESSKVIESSEIRDGKSVVKKALAEKPTKSAAKKISAKKSTKSAAKKISAKKSTKSAAKKISAEKPTKSTAKKAPAEKPTKSTAKKAPVKKSTKSK